MKNKIIKKLSILMLLVVILLAMGSYLFYHANYQPLSNNTIEISVVDGENASTVLNTLANKGLLKNQLLNKLFVKIKKPNVLKGTYTFNNKVSLNKLFSELSTKNSKYLTANKLQIIEGETIPQISKKVAKLLNIKQSVVLNKWKDKTYLTQLSNKYWFINKQTILNKQLMYPLEGYIYPDTYKIEKGMDLEKVTDILLSEMDKNLSPYKTKIENMNFSVHQFLTLASIVEKETLYEKDGTKIAGVFINRLKNNMRLESDITVNYALQRTGVDVTNQMLQTNSPYNTYKITGLPVGPVANVNKKVFDFIVNYEKHNYFFFFAKKDGTVIYSKTYAKHQEAVNKNKWY